MGGARRERRRPCRLPCGARARDDRRRRGVRRRSRSAPRREPRSRVGRHGRSDRRAEPALPAGHAGEDRRSGSTGCPRRSPRRTTDCSSRWGRGRPTGDTHYEPTLFRSVPADAVAAISFGGTQGALDRLQGQVDVDGLSQMIEDATGVSLDGIVDALSGEGVLYVRPGETLPEVTLALAPPDPDKTWTTVDRLARKLASETASRPSRRAPRTESRSPSSSSTM